jgi:hypothetical protein
MLSDMTTSFQIPARKEEIRENQKEFNGLETRKTPFFQKDRMLLKLKLVEAAGEQDS